MSGTTDHTPLKEQTTFENAIVGEGTIIEPNVTIGFRYHPDCGPARIGKNGILRQGTVIYGDATIGNYFQTGLYTVIRPKVKFGDYCVIFNHSTIEGIVHMGEGVRIMAHVYIPTRTWFGNFVFVGPGTTFLNGRKPFRDDEPVRGATVEDDVMIGGGCTILPGVTIGERSFIAAGAVVTKDVPPCSMVMGIPGRIKPLPKDLDCLNDHAGMQQKIDLWHPETEDLSQTDWPEDWGPKTWKGPDTDGQV